ncbi:PTPA-CTERM sorting domain-containing protein [Leptothoe sp. LEGE 181152]|nr:PTPA-CTERM sorting domain-containing protein [Leptothoe sp. LEGE 181152]
MFKRFSCVILGALAASLTASVEPAQAFRLSSGSSNSFTMPSASNSFSPSTGSFGQSAYGGSSSNYISQGGSTASKGDANSWAEILAFMMMLYFVAEGLDTTDEGKKTVVIDKEIERPGKPSKPGNPGNPGKPGKPPTPVPTPALLPGLIGMGVAACRKRNLTSANQA